jgi:hypothetical protein
VNARRKAAFDPSRLDELDDIMPVPSTPPTAPPAPRVAQPPPSITEPPAPAPSVEAPRRPRGSGGRPRQPAQPQPAAGALVAVAVRIPPTLYSDVNADLLAGLEKPSYGQLVVWACEDHPEAVVEGVRAARPARGSRRPRGHRLAAPDVQITLRMSTAERDQLDELAAQVQPEDGKPVTRTEVAIAALKQALLHPVDEQS